jgi:two-component system, LytTR family, sensor histidine kinase AlgZ
MSTREPVTEQVPYHAFTSAPAILAINSAGALITPIFFLLLAEGETGPAFLGRVFVMAMVYANAIGFPANWTIPRLYPALAARSPAVEWAALLVALIAVSAFGCLVGTSLLFLADAAVPITLFPWGSFSFGLWYSFKLCAFITVMFGFAIRAYEGVRVRLAATELKLRTKELERERAIKLAAEARLASLEAQLHPHFLFNTLNSISSLIPVNPERAERLIERMAALLRFSLDANRGGLVPLEQELKIVRDYLEIEQARLGRRLRYKVESGENLAALHVPPLSVQTLVENSIKFAVAPNREGGEIRVGTVSSDGSLQINVADTGAGFAMESVPAGHGLDNLRARLAVLFGNAAALTASRMDGWNVVSLKVPV